MMSLNYLTILIQCQIFKLISSISKKKHKMLLTNPPIHISINRINNNRLLFKIKDGYKLELQAPETVKLSGSTKKLKVVHAKN